MARSPFQGTYQSSVRPTIATAPDAIVYINGEQEVIGCPQCSRSFNLNKYITSIQMDLSVESSPGSANISLSIPRHTIDDFYFDGNAVVTTMMEVEIYAKGYYLVEGLPQYYPIFWGIVTEVSDNYSGGEHTVSIHCADILKWWEICKLNINSAFTSSSGQQGRNLVGNVFASTNPYDIIFSLASQSFGDILVGTGSMNAVVRETQQQQTFDSALSDMMLYWEKRFSRMRSNLVLYGANGVAVRGDKLFQEYSKQKGVTDTSHFASSSVRDAIGGDNGQFVLDPTSEKVAAFKTVVSNAGAIGIWQSEYQTKLELANAAKEAIGFEFYMDVTGDLVFKPPFYNLDVLGNKPISWVQDIDIIDWDFSESESEVVTQLTMQGNYRGTTDYGTGAEITPVSTATDYHLLRKYGWRTHPYNSEFLNDPQLIFLHGLDVLDRINSKRHRGSVTIPMRPELRLGFPIYIAPKDQIWYISGISHSIAFGGRATTTLTLTAKRSKFIAPRGLGDLRLDKFNGVAEPDKDNLPRSFRFSSNELAKHGVFKLNVTNAAFVPADSNSFGTATGATDPNEPLIIRHPKTGRLIGYPNVVMAYTRPFDPADISDQAGYRANNESNPYVAKGNENQTLANRDAYNAHLMNMFKTNLDDDLKGKYLNNRYQYGLTSAGVFVYAHDSSAGNGVISEVLLLPGDSLQVTPNQTLSVPKSKTALIRPVSDERGFEVIGHYQYGRRLSLKDGRLITNDPNAKTSVDLQIALSGDLSAMLTAQSQGLSTITTGYADPASVLSTLTPEDSETAAVLDRGEPKFVDVGDNFERTATLGSPEQKGSPSVEASQLSRALTLAEMSVKDTDTRKDEDCVCLTGRADLAFMATDYQVQTLNHPATEDSSSLLSQILDSGPIDTRGTQQAQDRVNLLQAQLNKLNSELQALSDGGEAFPPIGTQNPTVVTAQAQAIAEKEQAIATLGEELNAATLTLTERQAQPSSAILSSSSEVVSRVDTFLVNLYSALDLAHEQFEKAIRGDLLPGQAADLSNLNGPASNQPSEFAPPFSAPNRFMLGDATAAVGAVETNANNIAKAWSEFGAGLRSNAEKSSLSTQISQDQNSVARLTATRNQLESQKNSHTAVVGIDLQKQIDSLNKQISKLQQQILDNQNKLRGG